MTSPGPVRLINAAGRHPLPDRRPNSWDQQSCAVAAAVPAPQATAMERQISTPYINKAAPPPYHSRAEADADQEAAMALVNLGRQSNNVDPKNEHPCQLPEGFPSRCDSKGNLWSPRELEAAETLADFARLGALNKAVDNLLTINATEEQEPSACVNTSTPRLKSETQPKRKRVRDEEEDQKKKAKTSGNGKIEAEEAEEEGPQEEGSEEKESYKCPECGKRLSRIDHFVRHKKTHSRIREMFQCDVCEKFHSRMDNLKDHIRNVHNKTGPGPKPRVWYLERDEDGKCIRKWPADQPAPVTADNEAQVGEGGADTIDSSAQSDHEEGWGSGNSSSRTTTGTGSKFKPINRTTLRR